MVSQVPQSMPPMPHQVLLIPPRHCVLSQQPVQQPPLLQVPPLQGVPSGAGVLEQLPAWQASTVQAMLSSQLAQAAPAAPHSSRVVPTWQLAWSQHPVQQVPPRHTPEVQGVSSALGVVAQLPRTQVPTPHSPPEGAQSWHAVPPLPHRESWLPGWHVVCSQHPLHRLVGQVPPQPSSAPEHWSAHRGRQPSTLASAPPSVGPTSASAPESV